MDDKVALDQIVFSGNGGRVECHHLIREVRRVALAQGRSRDDVWMADLASSCMIDDALEWHIDLDRNIRDSWELLQQALLTQYSAPRVSETSESKFLIPTPAQAPAAASAISAAAAPPPPALAQNTSPSRTGRIEITVTPGQSKTGTVRYMGQKLGAHGALLAVAAKVDAVTVRYAPSAFLRDIYVVNSSNRPGCLALTTISKDNNPYLSPHDAVVALANPGFDAESLSSSYVLEAGYTTSAVWTVSEDGMLKAVVDGTSPRTEFCINETSGNLYAPISVTQFRLRFPTQKYLSVTLAFVPK